MKKTYSSVLIASLGALALMAGVRSAAEGASSLELAYPPITPEEASEKRDVRMIDELYARFVDCLQNTGQEERCYWLWRAECEKLIPWRCEQLELEMFGHPIEGEELCSLRSKKRAQDAANPVNPVGTPMSLRVPRD